MNQTNEPEIVATLEDDTGERMVDVVRNADGQFGYIEYHRTDAASDEWRQVVDDEARTYPTQFAAYTAATRDIDWLMD